MTGSRMWSPRKEQVSRSPYTGFSECCRPSSPPPAKVRCSARRLFQWSQLLGRSSKFLRFLYQKILVFLTRFLKPETFPKNVPKMGYRWPETLPLPYKGLRPPPKKSDPSSGFQIWLFGLLFCRFFLWVLGGPKYRLLSQVWDDGTRLLGCLYAVCAEVPT